MCRHKTLDGSEIGRQLEFSQHGYQFTDIANGNKPMESGAPPTPSRFSGICNSKSLSHSSEHDFKTRLSLEKDTDNVTNASISPLVSKDKEPINAKNLVDNSPGSTLTPHSMTQSSSHSRYCCDNIPVI